MQVSPYLRVANCSPATKPSLRGAEEAVLLHAQGRKPRRDPPVPHGQALQVGIWSGLKKGGKEQGPSDIGLIQNIKQKTRGYGRMKTTYLCREGCNEPPPTCMAEAVAGSCMSLMMPCADCW